MASDGGGAGKGFGGALLDAGTRLVARAAEKVLSDPRGQDAIARAVGLAQRGRRRVEEVQEKLMAVAGIPGRQDVQDLAKQLARIKRKARDLAGKLDPESRPAGSGGGGEGAGGGRGDGPDRGG
jgi:hypothetical protein